MNYFAHGLRFLDRPYFMAGTAIPDWLSAFDRKTRMRPANVTSYAENGNEVMSEIAAGVLQHWHDDRWFHQLPAFYDVSKELTEIFRAALVDFEGLRPGFLGHIVTELLLDAELIEDNPEQLTRYYEVMASVDPAIVEQCVNQMARKPTNRLAAAIPLFINEAFLADYLQPSRLLYRLNQVMKRVKLGQLPDSFVESLIIAREIVAQRRHDLLPTDRFC